MERLSCSSAGVLESEWETVLAHSKLELPAYVCAHNYITVFRYTIIASLILYLLSLQTPIARCTENSVRLVGGLNQFNGRVEVCKDGTWAAVCKDGFNGNEARAVCGNLGLNTSTVITTLGQIFEQPTNQMQMTYSLTASCSDSACNFTSIETNSQCSEMDKAGVFCLRNFDLSEPRICNSGEIRLTGGSRKSEGRLEVCLNGRWGTVCDDSWDDKATAVTCRQLGYQTNG